jgi:hypothetical protein
MKDEICTIENLNNQLFGDICKLIEEAKSIVANTANRTITLLYWKVGERINNDLLKGKRAGYGDQIVSQAATQTELPNKQILKQQLHKALIENKKRWEENHE